MLSKVLVLAAIAGLVMEARAECQNGCNKQGTCGANDQCVCYNTHRGNACEKRICPYGLAWTTTPNGDLNFDGDRHDSAIYSRNQAFTSRAHVVTQENKGGSWEMWPSYSKSGEGHHSMECSNAGLCDVGTGTCKCFEGFEGSACQRMSCPNQCSGHGRCMTIAQRLAAGGSSVTYTLWDKDMARSCMCDPGYSGNDCTMRICPRGDDPLTKVHQTSEVQTIEIYSDDDAVITQLGGTFTLTFKTLLGQSFTTSPITLTPHTSGSTTVSTAVEAALTALPNGVIPSVTVTQSYCEAVTLGSYDETYAATNSAYDLVSPTVDDWKYLRCNGDGQDDQIVYNTGSIVTWPSAGVKTNLGTAGNHFGCMAIKYPRCTRIYVKFSDPANAGSQNLMTVDVTNVLQGTDNNACAGTIAIKGLVTKTPTMYLDDTKRDAPAALFASVATGTNFITDTLGGNLNGATTITLSNPSGTIYIPLGSNVKIECTDANSVVRNMGVYVTATASKETAAAAVITFASAITDPHGYCANPRAVKLSVQTSYVYGNFDFTHSPIQTLGAGFTLGSTSIKSAVSSIVFDATLNTGFLLLAEEPVGVTANIASANTNAITLSGAGTTEAAECSDHGKCDYSSGLCTCFKGYTGEACQNQNALWLGA